MISISLLKQRAKEAKSIAQLLKKEARMALLDSDEEDDGEEEEEEEEEDEVSQVTLPSKNRFHSNRSEEHTSELQSRP